MRVSSLNEIRSTDNTSAIYTFIFKDDFGNKILFRNHETCALVCSSETQSICTVSPSSETILDGLTEPVSFLFSSKEERERVKVKLLFREYAFKNEYYSPLRFILSIAIWDFIVATSFAATHS